MNPIGTRILLVEDETPMRRFLRTALSAREFEVIETTNIREARLSVTAHPPEIILLDLGLPDGDGIAFTHEVRAWSQVPIIVLSARGREEDKVLALDAGADDYLTKPFGVNELLARIRVALRHAGQLQAGMSHETVLKIGPLHLNPERREVRMHDQIVALTPIEYRLLWHLARNAGRVLTHQQILKTIWGPHYTHQTHTLRVFMAQLRRKIEPDPAHPQLLMTEMGVGYRMRDDG
ncbi:MAG: response regulator [Magnetococcales bacterium]|nr:response regulator [Magnetococcales bacterium]NGZ05329.1 response regulator [Magnetococcales bacterium]